jgi:hypothetical protein
MKMALADFVSPLKSQIVDDAAFVRNGQSIRKRFSKGRLDLRLSLRVLFLRVKIF